MLQLVTMMLHSFHFIIYNMKWYVLLLYNSHSQSMSESWQIAASHQCDQITLFCWFQPWQWTLAGNGQDIPTASACCCHCRDPEPFYNKRKNSGLAEELVGCWCPQWWDDKVDGNATWFVMMFCINFVWPTYAKINRRYRCKYHHNYFKQSMAVSPLITWLLVL